MERILNNEVVNKVVFGGDYNPEQWDEATRLVDMEMLNCMSVDIVTLNVFSWARLQPDENTYDFSELDKIVKMVTDNGLKICMATSTAAHPAWMAKKYPDVTRVDFQGKKFKYGVRHNSCPNSPTYRKFSPLLAAKLAEHYKNQKNIVIWHISNEYGGECYCENCEKEFRNYLKIRYGSLENLNYEWNTNFWSHTFYDWDEIVVPNALSEFQYEGPRSNHQGIALDYKRFNSDGILRNYVDEVNAIRSIIPDAKVTTNFMMMFKTLDYKRWADYIDVISWDAYPQNYTETAYLSFNHDIMRGLKGGKPFMLMEQSATVSSYLPVNTMKRPGVMRAESYQAMAHGADAVMFFQMRKSPASCEMFHGALIDHSERKDTRVFKECSKLGKELSIIGERVLGERTPAKVALLFDWDNWWALEDACGINWEIKYPDELMNYYRALFDLGISVDIIGTKDEIDKYSVVFAPYLFMIKDGIETRLEKFVENGGKLITSLLSGYVTETYRIIMGGYPGPLKNLTGNWVEETCMLTSEEESSFIYDGSIYPAKYACDVIHNETSKVLSVFESDYFKGMPAVTSKRVKKGITYYIGTSSSKEFYVHFVENVCAEAGIKNALGESVDRTSIPSGVEVAVRTDENKSHTYIINHSNETKEVRIHYKGMDLLSGERYSAGDNISLEPKQVVIYEH